MIDLLTEDSDGSENGDAGDAAAAESTIATGGRRGSVASGEGRLRHYRGHVDGRPFALVFAGDAPAPLAMGHDGLSWRLEWKAGRMQLAAAGLASSGAAGLIAGHARPDDAATVVDTPARATAATAAPVRNWDVRLAAGAGRTLAVTDGRLLELGGGRARVLTRRVPGRVDALAVDGIGRAVTTVGGSALRYSARHGWRRLFEIPPR